MKWEEELKVEECERIERNKERIERVIERWKEHPRRILIVFSGGYRKVKNWARNNPQITDKYEESWAIFDPKDIVKFKNVDYIVIEGWNDNNAFRHLETSGLIELHNWRLIKG